MANASTSLDLNALALAKSLLAPRQRPQPIWPVLGAAGLLALSALTFATTMIMAPPIVSEHIAPQRGAR